MKTLRDIDFKFNGNITEEKIRNKLKTTNIIIHDSVKYYDKKLPTLPFVSIYELPHFILISDLKQLAKEQIKQEKLSKDTIKFIRKFFNLGDENDKTI